MEGAWEILLRMETKDRGKWRAHGCRVWDAKFKKNMFFFFFFVIFFFIDKALDQGFQWKNVFIEPKDNIKWREPVSQKTIVNVEREGGGKRGEADFR